MDEASDIDAPIGETLQGVVVAVLEALDLAVRPDRGQRARALAARCEALQHLTAAIRLLDAE